jgi:ubiquinone/menaquinone biosynthesis C-methylase UbiE
VKTDRWYYEHQGEDALDRGAAFYCSEPQAAQAVIDMALAHLHDSQLLLDVGCGANLVYDYLLADMGKWVIGVDFAMSFLRMAKPHARIRLMQADATALPFQSDQFDAVICSETIEHVLRDAQAIAEISRVLRPNGILLLTVPNLWNASRLIEMLREFDFTIRMMTGHLREYTPAHLQRLVGRYFTCEAWIPVGFGWRGRFGGPIDSLVRSRILRRFSKNLAFVLRKRD